MGPWRWLTIVGALVLATAADAPADETSSDETIAAASDASARMTVGVMVNGQGPFDFIVDTGADRTVISETLAARLKLPIAGLATVHGIAGSEVVGRAEVATLQVGTRRLTDLRAPILLERNLGALGMLGIDGLAGQQVVLDFTENRMTVRPSGPVPKTEADDDGETIVVRARRRHGQLILVDASIGGRSVDVIVDTGAQDTIANSAMRRLFDRRRGGDAATLSTLLSVTGHTAFGERAQVERMTLGGIDIADVPVVFSDVRVFERFGLAKRPAMLLGVDVLRSFGRVAIDFQSKKVRFLVREKVAMPLVARQVPPRG